MTRNCKCSRTPQQPPQNNAALPPKPADGEPPQAKPKTKAKGKAKAEGEPPRKKGKTGGDDDDVPDKPSKTVNPFPAIAALKVRCLTVVQSATDVIGATRTQAAWSWANGSESRNMTGERGAPLATS